jgi:hypothetical protein
MSLNDMTPAPKPYHCGDPFTHMHSLDCGHNVITSPLTGLFTSATSPKELCSSNCYVSIYDTKPQLPLAWLKISDDMHEHLFVCPACVEDQIRAQYPEFLEQHCKNGGKLTDCEETNVQLWTYAAVLEAVERGGRMCEATLGLFRFKYIDGFKALIDKKMAVSLLDGIAVGQALTEAQGGEKKWEMRDGDDVVMGGEKKERELGLEEDASKNALLAVVEKGDAALQEDVDMEMDDLADRLCDAKARTIENDLALNNLMAGLSRL